MSRRAAARPPSPPVDPGLPAQSSEAWPDVLPAAPAVADAVVRWQRSHGRSTLPWQGTRDPYRVWLSEIMLQQTQVATVLGYYARFLARFPDVQALAAAPLDDVLALWSGLGYYSRARHLHRCAVAVVQQHGGHFPASAAQLAQLPGIGRSTAAAIAAFCWGERAAILDGNVKRVLTRVLAFDADLAQTAAERRLWQQATALLPDAPDMPAYTQGLMDLGAGVCTARRPQCLLCPLQAPCRARQAGTPERYPVKSRRLVRGRREHWWLWLERAAPEGPAVWLEQRAPTGVWAGLWSFPLFDDEAALLRQARAVAAGAVMPLPTVHHVLTHFDWVLHPRRAVAGADPAPAVGEGGRWFLPAELPSLGLPAPVRKLLLAA